MKKILIIGIVVAFVIIGSICANIIFESNKVGEFNLKDDYFQGAIEDFPSNIVLGGPINTAKEARDKAEPVLLDIYGESVKKQKPYLAFYDAKNETWLINGRMPRNWFGTTEGGSAYILIKKADGKVLAVWHEK